MESPLTECLFKYITYGSFLIWLNPYQVLKNVSVAIIQAYLHTEC